MINFGFSIVAILEALYPKILYSLEKYLGKRHINQYESSFSDFIGNLIKSPGFGPYSFLEALRSSMFNTTRESLDIENYETIVNERLPSHLDIPHRLGMQYLGWEMIIKDAPLERSFYMAGFLQSFANAGNYSSISFFVGTGHIQEVKYALMESKKFKHIGAYALGTKAGASLGKALQKAQASQDLDKFKEVMLTWKNRIDLDDYYYFHKFFTEDLHDYIGYLVSGLATYLVVYCQYQLLRLPINLLHQQ